LHDVHDFSFLIFLVVKKWLSARINLALVSRVGLTGRDCRINGASARWRP